MITPSYGLTATERVLPRMALDFTTASLDPRVTFTRTGDTATVVNSSGYVAPINANLPRFDFNPVTLACNGLLIEESRVNLLLQSQTFQTTWAATACSIDDDATNGPDGLLTADKIIPNVAASVSNTAASVLVRQDITKAAAATTYTYSIFAKEGEFNGIRLFVRDNAVSGNNAVVTFSLVNGSVAVAAAAAGTFTNASASAGTLYANGFYRFSLTFTTGTETTVRILAIPSNSTSTTGDGSKGIFVWGAQVEANAFATSYIPTTTTSLTRNADVATMTGANFSDWYTATTGAAVVWAIPQTATGTRPLLQFDDTTANEIIALRGNVANPELYIVDGGAPQAQIDAGTIVANTTYKLSGAWNTDSCAAAQNGAATVTDNTATIPTPTQLRIGSDGTNYASALIQKIMYYPQRIIDAEVQAISK